MPSDFDAVQRMSDVFLDSYFVLDENRRVTAHNEQFVQLLGASPAERRRIPNSPCYELLKLEICKDNCIAMECLRKGQSVRMEEIYGRTASGDAIVLELSAKPLLDDAGEVRGVFVTHRDVTDERKLKTRVADMESKHRRETETLVKLLREREEELNELRGR